MLKADRSTQIVYRGGMHTATGDPNLGARLRSLRLDQGLSLKAVAEQAAISVPYLSEVERGRKLPALDMLARIANALDTNVTKLLRGLEPYDN
jgi:transcriptional regulator with XRE-family HTH domain